MMHMVKALWVIIALLALAAGWAWYDGNMVLARRWIYFLIVMVLAAMFLRAALRRRG